MNGRADYPDDMRQLALDDAVTEALLRGDAPAADPELATLAAFVRDMRATASHPTPAPSPALAALLRDGYAPRVISVPPVHRRSAPAGWRRRLAVTGIGLGVAVTGVVGAGAAGLLPGPVERVVGGVVERLTPLQLPTRKPDIDKRPADPRSNGAGDAEPSTVGGPGGGGEPVPGSRGPSSLPQPAPGPTGSVTSGAGPGSPTTGRTPAPGLTTPVVTPPSAPTVGPVPTTSTTLPGLPPVPTPTLPNTTLPVPLPDSVPGRSTTLPSVPR